MVQKASTPWSTRTVAEGGTDSPVGDLVPVPDEIKPVVDTGFISVSGKYTGLHADDLQFTFQDPEQAVAAGAQIEFPLDMLNHDKLIFAILDSSGNDINVDLVAYNPTTLSGPYTPFAAIGVQGGGIWTTNKNTDDGTLYHVLNNTSTALDALWKFYKIEDLRGLQLRFLIRSNEGADAGTISTAYLRLV